MTTAAKKSNIISRTVAADEQLLTAMQNALQIRQEALDAGFGPGGVDAIVDADFVGDNAHLNLAKFLDIFTAFLAVDTTLAANTRQNYIRLQIGHR